MDEFVVGRVVGDGDDMGFVGVVFGGLGEVIGVEMEGMVFVVVVVGVDGVNVFGIDMGVGSLVVGFESVFFFC